MSVKTKTDYTTRFTKDIKKFYSKYPKYLSKVEEIITLLEEHRNNEIPTDHKLHGKQKDLRECHILGTPLGNNLVLIYKYSGDNLILYLLRLGKHDEVLESKENCKMRFLKEAYGESNELDNFVYLQNNRFSTYYQITLVVNGRASTRYFAYEDAARDYYDKLIEDINNDKEYYEDTQVTFSKVLVNADYDELESFDSRLEFEEEEVEDID